MTGSSLKVVNTAINWLFFFSIAAAIFFSFWKYYLTKDYQYYVEGSCDPQIETCFYRDCEGDPDSCPPNGFSYYEARYVNAYDFPKCSDNSCQWECQGGEIYCEQIQCDSEAGDVCAGPSLNESIEENLDVSNS